MSGDGEVDVSATLSGGYGAAGVNGADGGAGGSATLDNAATGSTAGSLVLTQTAAGGAGGGVLGAPVGSAKDGGLASSSLDVTDARAAIVTATTYADGGLGGSTDGAKGGVGGTANSSTVIVGAGQAFGFANATGGGGGSVGSGTGANGNDATAYSNVSAPGVGGTSYSVAATSVAIAGGGGLSSDGAGGAGGNATATSLASGGGVASSVSSSATAYGGNGGSGGATGAGGNATASADTTANGGDGEADATAIGGAGATAGTANAQAAVHNASSGLATAQSTAQGVNATVTTTATALVGGEASAVTMASIGAGALPMIELAPGQAVALAELTQGAGTFGAVEFSAQYGGTVDPLTYTAEADFSFTTSTAEALVLDFGSTSASGIGFDSLTFEVTVNGTPRTYPFPTLEAAESFFSGGPLDLGLVGAGNQTVDLMFSLTASGDPPGFGVFADLGGTPVAAPEPSTWAMMLAGFAGLGFAASAGPAGEGQLRRLTGPAGGNAHDKGRSRDGLCSLRITLRRYVYISARSQKWLAFRSRRERAESCRFWRLSLCKAYADDGFAAVKRATVTPLPPPAP